MSSLNYCPNCGHDLAQYNGPATLEDNELFLQALDVVTDNKKATTSVLQRKLSIGYGRAARLMEEMEEKGLIDKADGSRPRKIKLKQIEEYKKK